MLPQAGLQSVVVRSADGTPREHAGRLIVQRSAGAEADAERVGASGTLETVIVTQGIGKAVVDVGVAKAYDLVAQVRKKWVVKQIVNRLSESCRTGRRGKDGIWAVIRRRIVGERRNHVVPESGCRLPDSVDDGIADRGRVDDVIGRWECKLSLGHLGQ